MRKRKTRNRLNSIYKIIRLVKESQKKKQEKIQCFQTITHEFNLSDTDKITYTRGVNNEGIIIEVVNVSYEIKINNLWTTIWRYDSEHGYLHCHMRISMQNPSETVTTTRVIKKGTPHTWFTWAINDIKKNYIIYRRGFMKRSKIVDNQ
ncbi:hypothetical protein HYU94_01650 [Candidatus Daviesbacteria bacterium]|nr:hypothetical protein [Candidatus Daviesbacteria bacterium]